MFRLCPEMPEDEGTFRCLGVRSRQGVRGDGFRFGCDYSDEDTFLSLSEEEVMAVALAHLARTAPEKGEK